VIYNSIIIGGLFFIDGIVFKHNFFRGEIIFNIKDSNSDIRENEFDIDVVDYLYDDDQTEGFLDLRFNCFSIDSGIEELLLIEDLEDENEDITLLFEPYYDTNRLVTDNDGLPNSWELKYGLNIHIDDALEDPDGDGFTNFFEFHYEPKIGRSMNPNSEDSDEDGMPDQWEIEHGLNPTRDDGGVDAEKDYMVNKHLYNDTSYDINNLNFFFSDGYGETKFTNYEEYLAGTHPLNSDTDDDGMEDGWEVHFGLDPLIDDSKKDPDNDGYSNLAEFRGNTDPTDKNDNLGNPDYTSRNILYFTITIFILSLIILSVVLSLKILKDKRNEKFNEILGFNKNNR
jgi:hypothetical protein